MTPEDVEGNEMDGPHDDAAVEALLRGAGRDVDPAVARVLDVMRSSSAATPPIVDPELAQLLGASVVTPRSHTKSARRWRTSIAARAAAIGSLAIAATGGLAVAHALPAPVQDVVSRLGVGRPAVDTPRPSDRRPGDPSGPDATAPTGSSGAGGSVATTLPAGVAPVEPGSVEPGSVEPGTVEPGQHSSVPPSSAGDLRGCAHGRAVAAVASDGKASAKSCPTTPSTGAPTTIPGATETTTSTVAPPTTSTTVGNGNGLGPGNGNGGNNGNNGNNGKAKGRPATKPH